MEPPFHAEIGREQPHRYTHDYGLKNVYCSLHCSPHKTYIRQEAAQSIPKTSLTQSHTLVYGPNIPSHMQTGKTHWPHTEIFHMKAALACSVLLFSIIIQCVRTGRLSNEHSMSSETFETDGIFTLFVWPIVFTSSRQCDCSAPPFRRSTESFAQSMKRQRLSNTNLIKKKIPWNQSNILSSHCQQPAGVPHAHHFGLFQLTGHSSLPALVPNIGTGCINGSSVQQNRRPLVVKHSTGAACLRTLI